MRAAAKKKITFKDIPVILSPSNEINFCLIPMITPSDKRENSAIKYPLPEDLSGKIIEDFYLEKLINVGSNGVLFKILDILDGNYYALKVMIPNEEVEEAYEDEIAAYNYLSTYPNCNKYIVCLYDHGFYRGSYYRRVNFSRFFKRKFKDYDVTHDKEMIPVSGEYFYLKLELMDTDFYNFISFIYSFNDEKKENWTIKHPDIVLYIISELIRALHALHSLDVAHLDIKSENILVKFVDSSPCEFLENPKPKNIMIKIGDLGLTCTDKKHRKYTNLFLCRPEGTPGTAAPEINRKSHQDPIPFITLKSAQQADIWSMGITIGEFLFPPNIFKLPVAAEIYNKNENEYEFILAYNKFIEGEDAIEFKSGNEKIDRDITELIYAMLNYYPKDRPSTEEILEMWF